MCPSLSPSPVKFSGPVREAGRSEERAYGTASTVTCERERPDRELGVGSRINGEHTQFNQRPSDPYIELGILPPAT